MLLAAVQSSGARRLGGGGSCLLHTERHRSGPACSPRVGSCTRSEPRGRSAPSAVSRSPLERVTMGNPRFLVTRSPNGRGLAPIGTGQHQICLVRPFLSRKAIFFWVLWAPYTWGSLDHGG